MHTKAEWKVLSCTCEHKYQDSIYGKGMRAHNPCKAGTSSVSYRCTVCGTKKG